MKTYYAFNSNSKMVACRANNKREASNKMGVKYYKILIAGCDLDYINGCIRF